MSQLNTSLDVYVQRKPFEQKTEQQKTWKQNPSEKDAPPQKSPTEMDSNIDNLKDLKDAAQIMPESPVPDYGEGDSPTPDSSFVFARKFKSVLTSIKQIDDYDEPAPDYLDEDDGSAIRNNLIMLKADDLNQKLQEGDGELIPPKKLVNPCLESKTRVALHKELKYQYKMGFNVLEKPELTRVLTKRKEQQRIQEWDDQKKASMKRSSLEMKLEQRANKLKEEEDKVMQPIKEDKEEMKPEMLKVHAKITQKSESNGIK